MTTATSATIVNETKRTPEDAPSLDALPAEILDHLLDLSANTPEALLELRLVSKRWCAHVDSRRWGKATELCLANSRVSGALVERLCDRLIQQPEKIVLEGCPNVTMTNLEPLFLDPRKAIHIKELRIENCNKIASKDFPLAKIIAACPNLEELTFISCKVSQEQRLTGSQRRKMGEDLIAAFEQHRKDAPPLRLLKTNALLPTKDFLTSCARFVERLELEELPFAMGWDCFAQGVLSTNIINYEDPEPSLLGWAFPSPIQYDDDDDDKSEEALRRRMYRSPGELQLLGGATHQLRYWQPFKACPITLEQKQLLCLSRDGSATLLDGQGNVTEDTPIDPRLRRLFHDLLDQGDEVWLSFLHVPGYPTILFGSFTTTSAINLHV